MLWPDQTAGTERGEMDGREKDLPTRDRILSVSVRLFLEQGYRKTTVADITREAHVSNSSFQHFFHAKDGILTELTAFMYESQFASARSATGSELPPVYTYAAETAIQLAICELDENLREIYLETYTHEGALEIVHRNTAKVLLHAFGPYQPELTERDFYALDVGTAGMMRGYMARSCDEGFTLEAKLRSFLTSALRVMKVPEDEVRQAVGFVLGLDVRAIARQVIAQAVNVLAAHYEFSPPDGPAEARQNGEP